MRISASPHASSVSLASALRYAIGWWCIATACELSVQNLQEHIYEIVVQDAKDVSVREAESAGGDESGRQGRKLCGGRQSEGTKNKA